MAIRRRRRFLPAALLVTSLLLGNESVAARGGVGRGGTVGFVGGPHGGGPVPLHADANKGVVVDGGRRRAVAFAAGSDVGDASSPRTDARNKLLSLLADAPPNEPTPESLTAEILRTVRDLEALCPTPPENVLEELGGTWELLWTAQDRSSDAYRGSGPLRALINPLENQSYSNNPGAGTAGGRSNPILPRSVQDRLEELGIVDRPSDGDDEKGSAVRSSQTIMLSRGLVRNVVSVPLPRWWFAGLDSKRASLTVDVAFRPNVSDARKVDVKFERCRAVLPGTPFDVDVPLGIVGPMGWLRTGYIDDEMRITRGHKGSVFVLKRPGGGSGRAGTR